jgi:hypothetical protein
LQFTPQLVKLYNQLKADRTTPFEIVFVSADKNDHGFRTYFSQMPWLAVPYSDQETRDKLSAWFQADGIPHLVLLDEEGKTISMEGTEKVMKEPWPFGRKILTVEEKLELQKVSEEKQKKKQAKEEKDKTDMENARDLLKGESFVLLCDFQFGSRLNFLFFVFISFSDFRQVPLEAYLFPFNEVWWRI